MGTPPAALPAPAVSNVGMVNGGAGVNVGSLVGHPTIDLKQSGDFIRFFNGKC